MENEPGSKKVIENFLVKLISPASIKVSILNSSIISKGFIGWFS